MISFNAVTKFHKGKAVAAVRELDLHIEAGEMCVFVGPSGCGKTTILRMINRVDAQDSGVITVNGVSTDNIDLVTLRRGIGFMMQSAALFPHRTVAENIATVPKLLGWSRAAIRHRVEELTSLIGFPPDLLHRYPYQLSGGQQSRVALARALASDPPVILMDEPFAALDPIIRERLQDELITLQRRLRKTIVLVTHDMDEALKLADRIAVFKEHGELVQFDSPQRLLAAPKNEFVQQFVGQDPSLKRLALMKVSDLQGVGGCLPSNADTLETTLIHPLSPDLKLVVNEQRQPLGWESRKGLKAPNLALVSGDETLHQTLLKIIDSSSGVAVRVDNLGRYQGCVTTFCLHRALNSNAQRFE